MNMSRNAWENYIQGMDDGKLIAAYLQCKDCGQLMIDYASALSIIDQVDTAKEWFDAICSKAHEKKRVIAYPEEW
jgi:transcription elongation factor Elf1